MFTNLACKSALHAEPQCCFYCFQETSGLSKYRVSTCHCLKVYLSALMKYSLLQGAGVHVMYAASYLPVPSGFRQPPSALHVCACIWVITY